MSSVFSHFSLPQISTVARRTALGALCAGVAGVLGLGLLGYAVLGLGMCIGLAMALGNFRLIQAATVKATAAAREDKRRPLALNTLARMGAISVVALGLVFLSHQLGFGVLLGLAIFQFMLLANVVFAMLRDPDIAAGGPAADTGAPGAGSPGAGDIGGRAAGSAGDAEGAG